VTYEEISTLAQQLSYRDKFRLAQLLLQVGRKEEEQQNPDKRTVPDPTELPDAELIEYVATRLLKLKPARKEGVLNSIGAMFQFQGGVSAGDKERLFTELVRMNHIHLDEHGRIRYGKPAA
jgi:hypothetical protein